MLRTEPVRGRPREHRLVDDDGTERATVRVARFRRIGVVDFGDEQFHFRAGLWHRNYTFTGPQHRTDAAVATATHVNRARWSLTDDGRTYRFERSARPALDHYLTDGTRTTGSIEHTSPTSIRLAVDLQALPPRPRVFAVAAVLTVCEIEGPMQRQILYGRSDTRSRHRVAAGPHRPQTGREQNSTSGTTERTY